MDRRMRDSAATPIYLFLFVYTTVYAFIPGVDGPISNQEALEDGNTTFYCDTTPETAGDEMMILVWYKNKQPIYSYEAGVGAEWKSPSYSDRLKADLHRQPTSLTISELKQYDQAVYHCRVDFAFSPTRNLGVNLTVVVLPSQPFFQDEMDNPVEGKIGPYHEGDTLVLRCLVIGGHPPPRISWYSGETLVDASDGANEVPGIRDNELYLPLTRENAAALSCRASNTNLRPPVVATLQIELFLPAYNVSMHWVEGTIDSTLQAGKPAVMRCRAYGSYPSPEITWWLDDRQITALSNQTWNNSTQTAISYLRLTPSITDNGGTLTCNATNPVMAPNRGSKADVITLNVTYSPIVGISKLGTGSLNEIVELDPLHLKCEVTANPPPDKIRWFFNDVEIIPGEIWGDNTTFNILYVEEATRHHTGRYSCSARNHVGENRSKHLSITVFFPPECAETGIFLVNESLYCNVVALPASDTFFWHVQPSGFDVQAVTNASPILPLTQITGPLSGPLKASCEAGNGVASQEKPCENTFSLESLRPPQPKQCDLDYEHGEFQMICVPVEHATYYEVSVWRMSTTNSSLLLERRGTMGFGGHALAAGGGVWLVRGSLGRLKAGDEAGASACNRYGCSRALLLRPTEASLSLASPPWWHFIMEKDFGISLGAVILVAVFLISTPLIIRLARRPRSKPPAPVIQVLQLDDVARDYLDTIGEHKVRASCSLRSCSSFYSDGSVDTTAPPVDRRRKPRALWDQWDPPPDVTLTLHRESAV